MIEIVTYETGPASIQARESRALLDVTGPGVRNRGCRHRVRVFTVPASSGRGRVVRCCDFTGCQGYHLSAVPTVIALNPVASDDVDAGAVAIGDRVRVDGVVRVVTAVPLGDPVLIAEG